MKDAAALVSVAFLWWCFYLIWWVSDWGLLGCLVATGFLMVVAYFVAIFTE